MNRRKRVEILITRKLDGVLTDEEALELERAVADDAESRSMLEETARLDAAAGDALRRSVGAGDVVSAVVRSAVAAAREEVSAAGGGSARWVHRVWWLAPVGLAAALAIVVIARPEKESAPVRGPVVLKSMNGAAGQGAGSAPWGEGESGARHGSFGAGTPSIQRVRHRPQVVDRFRNNEFFGIVGKDGRIYVIEVDRTRTYRQSPRGGLRYVGGGV